MLTDMRAGKGTLGALLVDPSVYEDLKLMLGNVERNRTLRALVRYSIKADERSPAVEVRDPGPLKARTEALGPGNSGGQSRKRCSLGRVTPGTNLLESARNGQ